MDQEFIKLIEGLKEKNFPDSVRFNLVKIGEKAFEYLFDFIQSPEPRTPVQINNALIVMQDMCKQACPSKAQLLFNLTKSLLSDSNPIVRARAARVVVGLIRMHDSYPAIYAMEIGERGGVMRDLRAVMNSAIDAETATYIEKIMPKIDTEKK